MPKNAIYAQSGGVTAVINAQACGVIETALRNQSEIQSIFAARNGIIGVLQEDLLPLHDLDPALIAGLRTTPGGAFGSCRYKLPNLEQGVAEYTRIMEVFKAHDIGYFFYNGGGDSQDTTNKIAKFSREYGYPITCIGIPKTIDNDLAYTDCSPGFGSVAKYVATSILEAGLDIASMANSSTKVFIMEVMGRHAGWIAAAGGLATRNEAEAPHIILFPEVRFDAHKFCSKVQECVERYGYCAVVASEGISGGDGGFVAESGSNDAFGHAQLGGVAPKIASIVKNELGFKVHWAVSDYLQRAARHIASATDVAQAYDTGKAAVEFALSGKNAVMPIIVRVSDEPYEWRIDAVDLNDVANIEKKLPEHFISADGYHITDACRKYLQPLIAGEDYPAYHNGVPQYTRIPQQPIAKKLSAWNSVR